MKSVQDWKSGGVKAGSSTLPLFHSSTLLRLTEWGARELNGAGIDQGRFEAQLLLAHALSVTRLEILASPDREVEGKARQRFVELVERRRSRVPLAYLRGT